MVSSKHRPHFTPGKDPILILHEARWAPGSVWTGGKSRSRRFSIPDRPARSQSLYRLSYPAHITYIRRLTHFITHVPPLAPPQSHRDSIAALAQDIYFATVFKRAVVPPCVYQATFPKTETAGASGQQGITFIPQSCVFGYV